MSDAVFHATRRGGVEHIRIADSYSSDEVIATQRRCYGKQVLVSE
jgi:hypothetical protein